LKEISEIKARENSHTEEKEGLKKALETKITDLQKHLQSEKSLVKELQDKLL